MEREKLQELINWLGNQIENANKVIIESQNSRNFGREAQYEGIRDAFTRCLKKLSSH